MKLTISGRLVALLLACLFPAPTALAAEGKVEIAAAGRALLPILSGGDEASADELQTYLERITGARFERRTAKRGDAGIYVGTAADFPWLDVEPLGDLGPEGCLIRSTGGNLLLIGHAPLGTRRAVTTFLHRLGCRWFWPGEVWEEVPSLAALAGRWDERHRPSFPTVRKFSYGFGAYANVRRDFEAWERNNRMGGPLAVRIGHTWHGLDPDRDFEKHPEWFAEVAGRRKNSKPCYSHPEVIRRAIASALSQAERDPGMISMTPPDGLGYCKCERCLGVLEGAEPTEQHSATFGRRRDGTLVSVESETVFALVNAVAAAVAEKHPETLVGCYAYSAYSHPPSFPLHPNVYLQTTTAFRRTSLSLDEQLAQFGSKTTQLGIREYYSVYQWDWDWPDPGRLAPARLVEDLKFFHQRGVTGLGAEMSNNWAARGLGYYLAANLLWDIDADVAQLVRDFYVRGFGPAAAPVERYYALWYGPQAAVLSPSDAPAEPAALVQRGKIDVEVLRAAFREIDQAAEQVKQPSRYRDRVDQLRMYLHNLALRYRLQLAEESGDSQRILEAIGAETTFAARLADLPVVHTRALVGKAFERRFRAHRALLAEEPRAADRGPWRALGAPPPDHEELNQLWEEDRELLEK